MSCLSAPTRASVLGVAARVTVLLLVFGLAECAAGSCLSYGHSCWGAHGKRSGNVPATEEVPEDGAEAMAAIAAPEDTRWFLSKLVRRAEPSGRSKMWQRFGGLSLPSVGDRRHKETQWKNSPSEEDPDNAGESETVVRSRTVESSEDGPSGILVPASGEYPVQDSQDGEVVLMADEQAMRRMPQNLRVYKIMNRQGRKLE
ncbi:hypothetical protein B7P43_G11825 [Cryptotermes secundus]|uniref:Uncharacterized protein n=1 Tax=Cryptotermes secundus TaxID=105785 RepID=A0A2J7PWY6_9NEOP|nr:uncharacterized protein LOC111871276 isoform X2 [Cryptotermes secundus]PNF20848.1 hypothetical protein B7P43_G11825 [Cryptotermes secundus]